MKSTSESAFTAPVFVSAAFLVFAAAFIEKALNLVGGSIPFVDVFPRQLLNWSVTLLIFDIALMLRQLVDKRS
jgi:hypothetical protein